MNKKDIVDKWIEVALDDLNTAQNLLLQTEDFITWLKAKLK